MEIIIDWPDAFFPEFKMTLSDYRPDFGGLVVFRSGESPW